MTLARRQPVYLIERFDRQQGAEGWCRLHSIDACQLMELAAAGRSAAVARTALFQWLVFNVLAGNIDAHLKKPQLPSLTVSLN